MLKVETDIVHNNNNGEKIKSSQLIYKKLALSQLQLPSERRANFRSNSPQQIVSCLQQADCVPKLRNKRNALDLTNIYTEPRNSTGNLSNETNSTQRSRTRKVKKLVQRRPIAKPASSGSAESSSTTPRSQAKPSMPRRVLIKRRKPIQKVTEAETEAAITTIATSEAVETQPTSPASETDHTVASGSSNVKTKVVKRRFRSKKAKAKQLPTTVETPEPPEPTTTTPSTQPILESSISEPTSEPEPITIFTDVSSHVAEVTATTIEKSTPSMIKSPPSSIRTEAIVAPVISVEMKVSTVVKATHSSRTKNKKKPKRNKSKSSRGSAKSSVFVASSVQLATTIAPITPTPVLVLKTNKTDYTTVVTSVTRLKTYTYVVDRVHDNNVEATKDHQLNDTLRSPRQIEDAESPKSKKDISILHSDISILPSHHEDFALSGTEVDPVEDPAPTDIDEARFNLATRVMSNGVELIVASDKDKPHHKSNVLRILPSGLQQPITLPPTTLKDQMIMMIPSELQENMSLPINQDHFVTKTCLTTYTYRTTYLKDGTTTIESHEKVVSNIATEERNYLKVAPTHVSRVTLSKTPELAVGVFHTTYTYLNALMDGEQPLVVSSKHTVANTITGPDDYITYLQPSEEATPVLETNTYYTPITLTTTLRQSDTEKVISTSNILTQVVITESLPPRSMSVMTSYIALDAEDTNATDIGPAMGSLVQNSIPKNHIVTRRTSDVIKTTAEDRVYETKAINDIHVYATKTYLTTFTYFTTILKNNQSQMSSTVIDSHMRVVENIVTESIPNSILPTDVLEKFRNELNKKQDIKNSGLTTLATLVDGQSLEVTAWNVQKPIQATAAPKLPTKPTPNVQPTAEALTAPLKSQQKVPSSKPTLAHHHRNVTKTHRPTTKRPTQAPPPVEDEDDKDENDIETAASSNSQQIYQGNYATTDDKNCTKNDGSDKTAFPGSPGSNLMSTFNINPLSAFGPVINAMAGLIQSNLRANRKNVTEADGHHSVKTVHSLSYVNNDIGENGFYSENLEQRPPVYIPVQNVNGENVGGNGNVVLVTQAGPTSLHISPPEIQQPNKVEINVGKPTHEIPLLNGGIPISPGEVITANSDVVVGRPAGVRPRIPLNNDIQENDSSAKGTQSTPNVIPLFPVHHHQTPVLRNKDLGPGLDTFIRPPAPPQKNPHALHATNQHLGTLQQRLPPATDKRLHYQHSPLVPPPVQNVDTAPPQIPINRGVPNSEILDIKRMPEIYSADLPASQLTHSQYQSLVKVFPFNPEKPMLVNIQPSQTANVMWGSSGNSASIYIVDNAGEPHKNGQYFDEPSPYPPTVGVATQEYPNKNFHENEVSTSGSEQWPQKPILSNQRVNLDANVLSHNVDIHVPPITFKKESEFPHSTPIQGHRSPDTNPNGPHINMAHINLPYDKEASVDLTPHHIISSHFGDGHANLNVVTGTGATYDIENSPNMDSVSASSVSVPKKIGNEAAANGQNSQIHAVNDLSVSGGNAQDLLEASFPHESENVFQNQQLPPGRTVFLGNQHPSQGSYHQGNNHAQQVPLVPPKHESNVRTPNYYEGYKNGYEHQFESMKIPLKNTYVQHGPEKPKIPRNNMPPFLVQLPPKRLPVGPIQPNKATFVLKPKKKPPGMEQGNGGISWSTHIPVGGLNRKPPVDFNKFGHIPHGNNTQKLPPFSLQQAWLQSHQPLSGLEGHVYKNQLSQNAYVEPPNPHNNHLYIVHDYNIHETLDKDKATQQDPSLLLHNLQSQTSIDSPQDEDYSGEGDEVVQESNSLPVLPDHYLESFKVYQQVNTKHNRTETTTQATPTPKPQRNATNPHPSQIPIPQVPSLVNNDLHHSSTKYIPQQPLHPFESQRTKPFAGFPGNRYPKPFTVNKLQNNHQHNITETSKPTTKTPNLIPAFSPIAPKNEVKEKESVKVTQIESPVPTKQKPQAAQNVTVQTNATKQYTTTEMDDTDSDSGEIFDFKETMNPHNAGFIHNLSHAPGNRYTTTGYRIPSNHTVTKDVASYTTTFYPFVHEPAVNMRPPPPPTPKTEKVMGLNPPPPPITSAAPSLTPPLTSMVPPKSSNPNVSPSLKFKEGVLNRYQPSEAIRTTSSKPHVRPPRPSSVPALYYDIDSSTPKATTQLKTTTDRAASTTTSSKAISLISSAVTPTVKEKEYITISRKPVTQYTTESYNDSTTTTVEPTVSTTKASTVANDNRDTTRVTKPVLRPTFKPSWKPITEKDGLRERVVLTTKPTTTTTTTEATTSSSTTASTTRTTKTTKAPPLNRTSSLYEKPTKKESNQTESKVDEKLVKTPIYIPSESAGNFTAEIQNVDIITVTEPSAADLKESHTTEKAVKKEESTTKPLDSFNQMMPNNYPMMPDEIIGSEYPISTQPLFELTANTPTIEGGTLATPIIEGPGGKRVRIKIKTATRRKIIPTKFITNTKTLTVTTTKTTVIRNQGTSSTHTLMVTKTQTSTIVDTITETVVQTLPHEISPTLLNIQPTASYPYDGELNTNHPLESSYTPKRDSSEETEENLSEDSAENSEFVISYEDNYEINKFKLYPSSSVHPTQHYITPAIPTSTIIISQSSIPPTQQEGDANNDSIFVVMTDKKNGPLINVNTSIMDTAQNDNTKETVHDTDTDPQILLGGVGTITRTSSTNFKEFTSSECRPDCKATRNELCQAVDGVKRCVCRPGFARMFPDRPCKPTYTYTLKVPLERYGNEILVYNDDMSYRNSDKFFQLAGITHEALDRMVMQSDFRDVYYGVHVTGFEKSPKDDGIIGNFYLQLSDNTDENHLLDVFKKYLRSNNYSIGRTEMFSARSAMDDIEATDFDECLNSEFHDCSDNALCFNLHGTYTCSCREGYADLSENAAYPGRICSAEVEGCEKCYYHGSCVTRSEDEQTVCECFPWYTGAACQVNIKILLTALVAVVTLLLILLLFYVLITYSKQRRVKNVPTIMSGINIAPPRGGKPFGENAKIDKRPMIKDSSSETSHNSDTLPYFARKLKKPSVIHTGHHAPPHMVSQRVPPSGHSTASRPPRVSTLSQMDRQITVLIPRAKYHPVSHCTGSHLNLEVQPMQNAAESKVLSYLDAGAQPADPPRRSTHSKHPRKSAGAPPPPGALISAGFEVSATVNQEIEAPIPEIKDHTLQKKTSRTNETAQGNMTDTESHYNYKKTESYNAYMDNMDAWLDKMEEHDLAVSETRSYDETTIQPATKSISRTYEKQLSHITSEEANTMAERDIGSTFLLPHTHLYKPDRGSEMSGFDSF